MLLKKVEGHISKISNTSKITSNSHKLVMKRIERIIKTLVHDAEDPNNAGNLSFENLGIVLQKVGIFQNLEFNRNDKLNQTSLSINQVRIKPERLNAEVNIDIKLTE